MNGSFGGDGGKFLLVRELNKNRLMNIEIMKMEKEKAKRDIVCIEATIAS